MEKINEIEFNQAIELRDMGRTEEAIAILSEITKNTEHSRLSAVFGVLAGIYFDDDDFNNAFLNFEKVTTLSPKSELGSLGLFHSLWELGKIDKALTELERYLTINPQSQEYLDTLREIPFDSLNGNNIDRLKELRKVFLDV